MRFAAAACVHIQRLNPPPPRLTEVPSLSRSQYTTTHYANVATGGASIGVKLVGHMVHGVCICLWLVPQWLPDDANLVTTINLLTLEKAFEVSLLLRVACTRCLVAYDFYDRHHVTPHGETARSCHSCTSVINLCDQLRAAKGPGPHAPPEVHTQLDGVSTNWGKTNFGFNDHLVRQGILASVKVARGVGGFRLLLLLLLLLLLSRPHPRPASV